MVRARTTSPEDLTAGRKPVESDRRQFGIGFPEAVAKRLDAVAAASGIGTVTGVVRLMVMRQLAATERELGLAPPAAPRLEEPAAGPGTDAETGHE